MAGRLVHSENKQYLHWTRHPDLPFLSAFQPRAWRLSCTGTASWNRVAASLALSSDWRWVFHCQTGRKT